MLNIRNRATMVRIAGVIVAGGALAIAVAGIGSAATQHVPLHQATPITAAGFSARGDRCANIPSTEDGWAFVLPGSSTVFVSLTVRFNPGGTQRITTFGPPTDKHAYVGSAPGAVLESASATVQTQDGARQVAAFNLSHTCPAATATPSGSPTATPSGSPTATPTTPATSSAASPSPSPTSSALPAPAPTPVHTTLPVTG